MATNLNEQYHTLVLLASKNKVVPYDVLNLALGITDDKQLEDFIVKAVSADIIQGRLNPAKSCLEITDWRSESLGETDLQFMTETLEHWSKHCNDFMNSLGKHMENSNQLLADFMMKEKRVTEEAENMEKLLNVDELSMRKLWTGDNMDFRPAQRSGQKPDVKRFKSALSRKRGEK